jgi:hypothetical protein
LALYEGSALPRNVPETEFDRLAGDGAANINRNMVSEDLKNLQDKASRIKNYANRRIAHFNESGYEDFPTFGDLDDCLGFMEELLKKYMLLLHADSSDILPTFLYDWKKIFRYPWIEK